MLTTTRSRAQLGIAAAMVAVFTWGGGSVVIKLSTLPGTVVVMYRLWLGASLMLLVTYASGRRLRLEHWRYALPGGIAMGCEMLCTYNAVKLTSVANVNLICALQPVLSMLVAGRLFGERITRRDITWTFASLAGVAVVIIGGFGSPSWNPAGDVIAVGSLLCWTSYMLLSKRARTHVGALEYLSWVMVVAAAIVTPFAFATQRVTLPDVRNWAVIGTIALVTGGAGHLLMAWAHKYVPISRSSILTAAVPILASISAYLVLGEHLSALQVIGGTIVVFAIVMVLRRHPDAEPEEPI